MKEGRANKDYIDFSKYKVPFFSPLASDGGGWTTCGSAAISMLTGESARSVEGKLPRGQLHWTDNAIVKYLKSKGLYVRQVTWASVVNYRKQMKRAVGQAFHNPFSEVVLLCGLDIDDDASWFVVHNDCLWHNYVRLSSDASDMLGYRSQCVYIVWRKKWQKSY